MAKQERRVGYGLPVVLAVGLHVGIVLLSVLRWPVSEPEQTSSAIVQATLVSAETATDRAQRAKAAQARAAEIKAFVYGCSGLM